MLSGIRKIGKYAYASCPDLEIITIDAPECIILGKEFWTANKLKMDLEKMAIDCRNCTDKVCMKECRRGLYIPG